METTEHIFSKINNQLSDDRPFVVYAKPGQREIVGLFQRSNDIDLTNSFSETGFVFAPFDGNNNYLIAESASDIVIQNVDFRIDVPESIATDFSQTAKENYENIVAKAVDAIKHGAFGKVVLSRNEIVNVPDFDVETVFKKLLCAYPNAFRYCWFHPETGLWLGATPEQLIKAKDKQFNTVALAGTQPYKGTEDVEWQEKEMEEQQFVTDFISESLLSNVSGMTFSEPYTAKAGNLLHIKTDIEGTLQENFGLKPILTILHPTPAVCGFPKTESKRFILENEGYEREFYSGFLGELNKDFASDKPASDLFVNLRCMKITGSEAQLFMGCGITKDSVPEKEFIETVNKSLTMKRILS